MALHITAVCPWNVNQGIVEAGSRDILQYEIVSCAGLDTVNTISEYCGSAMMKIIGRKV